MLLFLLVPVQDNSNGKTPPSHALGTIPTNGSYNAKEIKHWLSLIYRRAKKFKLKVLGVAADNYPAHQSLWRQLMFSNNPHYPFLRATYALFQKQECVMFTDTPHLLRNWLYNLQNVKKIVLLWNWPILYENND